MTVENSQNLGINPRNQMPMYYFKFLFFIILITDHRLFKYRVLTTGTESFDSSFISLL